ncbi:hypothetical protein CC2G_014422 [Coprinopsis cinerea AmutBmut pab1-1]|nr:hypothetical protein CC2G_014422 [Coprinopsis cinerea AmutBmut pab1-1]
MVSGETARITRSKSARKATTNRPPRDAARRTTGVRKAKAPARRVKKETQKIVSESDDANLGTVHVPRRSTIAIRSMSPHGSYNSKSGAAEVDLRAILFGRRGNQAVEGGTKSHQLEVGGDQGGFELKEGGGDQDEFQSSKRTVTNKAGRGGRRRRRTGPARRRWQQRFSSLAPTRTQAIRQDTHLDLPFCGSRHRGDLRRNA